MHRRLWQLLLAAPALTLLFLYGLDRTGLLGPDEPRYAFIGREMARSGDWVTPRLYGEPWFEKPPLLYWLIAAGYRAGLDDDLAPRLPVALLSAAFLVFFYFAVRREFSATAAWYAAAMLSTCAGWLIYGQIGVTDAPLTAAFTATVLLFVRWTRTGRRRDIALAGVCLGVAALAKGLVPIALAVPLVWFARRKLSGVAILAACAVLAAAPWYILCWLRNGSAFVDEFFWRHHFARFTSGELQHVQPWWFYVLLLPALLYPWSPLLFSLFRRDTAADARARPIGVLAVWGFLFFSAATNKLPGYVLPLVPLVATLIALRLERMTRPAPWLAACALLIVAVPAVVAVLPEALAGSAEPQLPSLAWWLAAAGIAAAVYRAAKRSTALALALVAGAVACAVLYIKVETYPRIDSTAAPRALWRSLPEGREVCLDGVHRAWRYGLAFYAGRPLPECGSAGAPVRITGKGDATRPEVSVR